METSVQAWPRSRRLLSLVAVLACGLPLCGDGLTVVEHRIAARFPAAISRSSVAFESVSVNVKGKQVPALRSAERPPVGPGVEASLDVSYPAFFTDPMVVRLGRQTVALRPAAGRAAAAHAANGKIAYEEAYRAVDVLHIASRTRSEELLLLREAEAPLRFDYRIEELQGVAQVVIHDGAIRFLGDEPSLEIERPTLIDATGRRTTEHAHWELLGSGPLPETLRLIVDPKAEGAPLVYPILVDPSFKATGSLNTSRSAHTATLLPNGKVLIAGGWAPNSLSSAELYDPTTGTVTVTGSMNQARRYHTATLLPNGKVLIAGGFGVGAGAFLTSAELYDPATGTFTMSAGTLTVGREAHRATLLANGDVLLTGGWNDDPLASAELYDTTADTFTATTGAMQVARYAHTSTLLANGKVLIAGGGNLVTAALGSAELYDPTTKTFSYTAGNLVTARHDHCATLLANGKVLLTGGFQSDYLTSAELFDPLTGTFAATTGTLATKRYRHTSTLLPNGKVLVAGGTNTVVLTSAELFDPAAGTFSSAGSLNSPRNEQTATMLPNGRVLFTGGQGTLALYLSSTEVWDPATGAFGPTGNSLGTARWAHTATLLATGKVLLAGGGGVSGYTASAEIYDPSTATFSATSGPMAQTRGFHTATLLPDGTVLITGGEVGPPAAYRSTAELFNPATATFSATNGPMTTARTLHTATLLPNGKVLIAGGYDGSSILGTTELYDPLSKTFTAGPSLGTARRDHSATLLPNGKVLLAGGRGAGSALTSAELYDWETNTVLFTGVMSTARQIHSATLLERGKVLLAGGQGDSGTLSSAEIYDPGTGLFSATSALNTPHYQHTATRLNNGSVLIAGGQGSLTSVELYDPATATFSTAAAPAQGRYSHSATLLPNGKVLIAGGYAGFSISSAELFTSDDALASRKPAVTPIGSPLSFGTLFSVTGTLFGGDSEGSSGTGSGSATNYPLVTLRSIESGRTFPLVPDSRCGSDTTCNFSDTPMTLDLSDLPASLDPGWMLLHVTTNGVRSDGQIVEMTCSPPSISAQPADATVNFNGSTTFTVSAQGGRTFQWRKGGVPIDGENGATFTTPPAAWTDSGTVFDVVVSNSCGSVTSDQVILRVNDPIPPTVNVVSPLGGEYWLLSAGTTAPSPAANAVYHAGTGAPRCAALASSCDSTTLLTGRGNMSGGAEPNQPNTIGGSCSDGSTGSFHSDESVDRIKISTVDGSELAPGKLVQIEVTVWSYSSQDVLGIYLAADASNPSWQLVHVFTPSGAGPYVVTTNAILPSGGAFQAVRASFVFASAIAPCVAGSFNDRDDLVFAVGTPPDTPRREVISWTMSDNVRVCSAAARLLYSNDGGATYSPAPYGGSLPVFYQPGGACTHPGETRSTVNYDVPASFPSGRSGSLYKIEVAVQDYAGNPAVASSDPFYIVQPNADSVKTLILWNRGRMISLQGISTGDADQIGSKLQELANHPRVQGLVVDLSSVPALTTLYADWDAARANPAKANAVLFGSNGIHQYLLRNLLSAYSGVEYLVLVGDDRIIPMARAVDNTVAFLESHYPQGGDLAGSGVNATSVGEALAADRYLTDDPLASLKTVNAAELDGRVFLPDLRVGRLVESPQEIIKTIATFISQDGILDLTQLNATTGKKVLVTGYDFLSSSATEIAAKWKAKVGDVSPDPTVTVDGTLIGADWGIGDGETRKTALKAKIAARYGIMAIAGHATHYEEGVPGTNPFDIDGLSTSDLYTPSVDLAGSVVYAAGCHGGLTLPGSNVADANHSLDLPQTMLAQGVVAYVANSGYGWGLRYGIGYAGRLMQIFTEEMVVGETNAVGEVVNRSKQRYTQETPRPDAYDEKTVMQWTTYGLPMYVVKTATAAASRTPAAQAQGGEEMLGAVRVKKELLAAHPQSRSDAVRPSPAALPQFLLQLNLSFDFTGEDVYRKHASSGAALPPGPGCSDPVGCYYSLNGLYDRGTGSADLPIEPYLIYDSRLSGTSQHGVLWKGGTYDQESSWKPVFAELMSNGGDTSNHGVAPRVLKPKPTGPRVVLGPDPPDCRASDAELNSLTVTVGESVKSGLQYSINRRYRNTDLEVFYFNSTALSNSVAAVSITNGGSGYTSAPAVSFTGGGGSGAAGTAIIAAGQVVRVTMTNGGSGYTNAPTVVLTGGGGSGAAGVSKLNGPKSNCDRSGPELRPGPYAGRYDSVTGNTVTWGVPVRDADSAPWRVMIVYNLNTVDGQGRGTWIPVELTEDPVLPQPDDGTRTYRGSVSLGGPAQLTYVIQAVDTRGNVTWLDYVSASTPSSGVPLGVAQTVEQLVNMTPAAPASVTATATGTTSVAVSWTEAVGAATYDVYRSASGTSFAKIGSSNSTSYPDGDAAPGTAYLYAVKALDGGGGASAYSPADLATTVIFTDPTLTGGVTTAKRLHVTELRAAVNAVRTLAGLGAFPFADTTITAGSTPIRAVHVGDLRAALDAARAQLLLPALSYTNPSLSAGVTIKAAHITEIRNGVK